MKIEQVVSGQAGLAGVQWALLDSSARRTLRRVVASILETPDALGDFRITRAKYKPGRQLTAYYDVAVRDGTAVSTRLIEVVWRPGAAAEALNDTPMQEEIVRRRLAAPFRQLSATLPAWGLRVQVAPLDLEFPHLARLYDPVHVALLVAEAVTQADRPPTPAAYTITPVRYRPGQRHVLRYDPVPGHAANTLFAKVYNDGKKVLRTFQTASAICDWLASHDIDITAVRPQALVIADKIVLYPQVSGTPLSQLLRQRGPRTAHYLQRAGSAIRALHETPTSQVSEIKSHSFASEIKAITSASEHVQTLLPETGATITRLLDRAAALYQRLPEEPPGFAYGDFKADHLWFDDDAMLLIDFDTCYLADQAIDLGKFLADLDWWHDVYAISGVEEAQEQFIAGYGPLADGGRLLRARLYEALVLVKSTARRVKLFERDWADRTARLVAQAVVVMDQLEAREAP